MGLLGAMVVGGATSAIVGRRAARKQFEAMSTAQAQQAQIDQAKAQAAQGSNQGKKDTLQELERLASFKQQGLITEEEFQKLKMRLLSSI